MAKSFRKNIINQDNYSRINITITQKKFKRISYNRLVSLKIYSIKFNPWKKGFRQETSYGIIEGYALPYKGNKVEETYT